MKWKIVLILVAIVKVQISVAQDGKVKGSDLPAFHQPLYLVPNTLEFWPYAADGTLNFQHQKSIDLYCESGFRTPSDDQRILRATYSALTNRFKVGTGNYKLEDMTCKLNPEYVAERQGSCGGHYELIRIGYNVIGRGFKSIYEICFDNIEMVTKYVQHTLRPGILLKSKISSSQENFRDLLYYRPYMFSGFYKDAQNLKKKTIHITRGHLGAQADFFYGAEQIATYTYLNCAPQWSTFNNGNWEELERLIRSNLQQRTLECFTGVLGVMPYENDHVKTDALYLDKDGRRIPTPTHYFRVVYEPRTQKGVVFVGVNNVFQNKLPNEYIVCNPITHRIKGIALNQNKMTRISRGYLYACDFHEFQKKFSYLPSLPVTSLLFEDISTA